MVSAMSDRPTYGGLSNGGRSSEVGGNDKKQAADARVPAAPAAVPAPGDSGNGREKKDFKRRRPATAVCKGIHGHLAM